MGKIIGLLLIVIIGSAAAAPWRCTKTCEGATVCFAEPVRPIIQPPSISIPQPIPPCTGPITIITPSCPCPPPCAPPCNPCNPCPPPPCNPCICSY
nr:late cornified envelope-like proline-rich protein 1 isoform X2 [Plodia interpunctella]